MKESLWNKDGLLFKFNYAYTFRKPEEIISNRCRLFWRTFIMSPPIWCGVTLALVFVYGISFPIFFLFGVRPAVFEGDSTAYPYVPYKKWPTVRGHRVLPIVVISVFLSLYLLYLFSVVLLKTFSAIQIYFFAAVVIVLLIYGIVKLSRTEIGLLFREHLTEKTRNWCPTVRFVSKDELKKVDFSQQSD